VIDLHAGSGRPGQTSATRDCVHSRPHRARTWCFCRRAHALVLRASCIFPPAGRGTDLLLTEIRAPLRYVHDSALAISRRPPVAPLSAARCSASLTTALGIRSSIRSRVDEPSIGLIPGDMSRVDRVMQCLRDAGNSLVVVEHDPRIMLRPDRLMDMGGTGRARGEIVFFGTPDELKQSKTLTADISPGESAPARQGGAAPRGRPRSSSSARPSTT